MSIVVRRIKSGFTFSVNIYLPLHLQEKYGRVRINKTFVTEKDAKKWELKKNKEIEAGFINIVDDMSVEVAVNEYLTEMRSKWSMNTYATGFGYLKNYLIPVFKEKQINKLIPFDVQKFNKYIDLLVGKSEKTKHNICSFFRGFLRWAKDKNYLENDLYEDVAKHSQKPENTRDFLVISEIQKFIDLIDNNEVRELATIMVFTGLRISETIALQFKDIDFDNNILHITKQVYFTTKVDKGYVLIPPKCNNISSIPLNDIALMILKGRWCPGRTKKDDFVFSHSDGTPFRKDGFIKNKLENAVEKMKSLGLLEKDKKITFHSLRHTYASMLVHLNENIFTVQHLLRHKDFRLTYNTYAHMYPDKKPVSFATIDNEFGFLYHDDDNDE